MAFPDRISESNSAFSGSDEHCGNTEHENDFKTHSFVYADCHSSYRGIFAGLMLLIMAMVFIILLFVGVENEYEITKRKRNGTKSFIFFVEFLGCTLPPAS